MVIVFFHNFSYHKVNEVEQDGVFIRCDCSVINRHITNYMKVNFVLLSVR